MKITNILKSYTKKQQNAQKIYKKTLYLIVSLFLNPVITFASDIDPASKAAMKMHSILFGMLGTSLVGIIIGATFLMAKTGKITWDRFVFIGCCAAGFLGSPLIVTMIKDWVA